MNESIQTIALALRSASYITLTDRTFAVLKHEYGWLVDVILDGSHNTVSQCHVYPSAKDGSPAAYVLTRNMVSKNNTERSIVLMLTL